MTEKQRKREGRIQMVLERFITEVHRLMDLSFFGTLTIKITFTDGGIAGASLNVEEKDICKNAIRCANQLDNTGT